MNDDFQKGPNFIKYLCSCRTHFDGVEGEIVNDHEN